MKKLCIAMGCLILMQTSAFSLTFLNDVEGQTTIVSVTETVQRQFQESVKAHKNITYTPEESAKRIVAWHLLPASQTKPTTRCNVDQKMPLSKSYRTIMFQRDPKGIAGAEYKCALFEH